MEAPALDPDSSTLFVGRKGGKLWDAPPSANLSGGWVPGGRGGSPPGIHCPFHGAQSSQVTAGGHRGAGQAWAQSLLCPGSSRPTRAHMHKHTALRKPKTHSQQPPTHWHTQASIHLRSPRHRPVYLLPGSETHTWGARPAPPACPSGPLRHPDPLHAKSLELPKQPTPLTFCTLTFESRPQARKGLSGLIPTDRSGREWEGVPILQNGDTEA